MTSGRYFEEIFSLAKGQVSVCAKIEATRFQTLRISVRKTFGFRHIRRQIEGALPTVVDLLQARGETVALRVLTLAEIDLQHTGDDNWNGGTELWTAFIRIPVSSYVEVEDDLKRIVDVINAHL